MIIQIKIVMSYIMGSEKINSSIKMSKWIKKFLVIKVFIKCLKSFFTTIKLLNKYIFLYLNFRYFFLVQNYFSYLLVNN